MARQSRIILITGANGGIGFGLAKLLLEDESNHVIVGSRSVEKGEAALKQLQSFSLPGSAELVQLDVTSTESITAAADQVENKHGYLDCLVNNAALGPGPDLPMDQKMEICFRTNAIGPYMTMQSFAPLLRKSPATPRLVNITSGGGSIGIRLDKTHSMHNRSMVQYRSSKSALNMITACQAVDYGAEGMKVFAFCPGFTVSNLSEANTRENGAKPTEEACVPIRAIIYGERDEEHAGFLHVDGQYPW